MLKISIITTLKNEVTTIGPFIEGILNQTYPVDELVICDGGSTDGTIEIIKEYAVKNELIKLVIKPGNRSVGRNEATRQARNEIVAVTDVGTVADKDWLKYLIEPFEKDSTTQVVGGFFKIKPETFFEEVSASLMLSDHDQIDPKTWLPSSRNIAFTKTAWQKAGGYPEHTPYNEDTPFDLALKKAGYEFAFAQKSIVYWRPRPNLKEFYKQYFNYAIGDGLDRIHIANYVKKICFYIVLFALPVITTTISLLSLNYSIALSVSLYLLYLCRRSHHMWRKKLPLKWLLYVPVVITAKDIADILGYIRGFNLPG